MTKRHNAETQALKKEVYLLKGLGCANCAHKMEININELAFVHSAHIDFVNKKLYAEILEDAQEFFQTEAQKIVSNIESGVEVAPIVPRGLPKEKEKTHTKEIFLLTASAVCLVVAMFFNLKTEIKFLFYLASYLLVGGEILARAGRNIIRGQVFDENFLMSLATLGAFAIGQYSEGVAVMLFYQTGELFQDYAVDQSRKSITSLVDVRPNFATLKDGGFEKVVEPEQVEIGQFILVRPGEKIPLDGEVTEGVSMVDTSALTGESLPRDIAVGDKVLGGFINQNGMLTIKVIKEYQDTTISKILDLVENASSKKAPTENFITKFASYYTPVVVLIALTIALIPPLVLPGATFQQWIYRALVFLVISCPCALVISIPLGFFGGIGAASRQGILVKGGNYLEALQEVDTIVFDKTGTLTQGIFKVTQICPADGWSAEELVEYAAIAEGYSNHPIALSILDAYGKDIDKAGIKDYSEVAGNGVKLKYQDRMLMVGNAKLMLKEMIKYQETEIPGTILHVAVDGVYAGYLVISDEIKGDVALTIKDLKAMGIRETIMLTGDTAVVAEKIAREAGIDRVFSELLPDEKLQKLETLYAEKLGKGKIAFVGDGINDAPALARADVGIAMGGIGSDAAIEAADVVIMTDEPAKIATAIKIAGRTKTIVWQNIVFTMGVKIIVLVLGAGGLATMWEAVFADVGVALIAVVNAIRVIKS